jgi:hypothetical protein
MGPGRYTEDFSRLFAARYGYTECSADEDRIRIVFGRLTLLHSLTELREFRSFLFNMLSASREFKAAEGLDCIVRFFPGEVAVVYSRTEALHLHELVQASVDLLTR